MNQPASGLRPPYWLIGYAILSAGVALGVSYAFRLQRFAAAIFVVVLLLLLAYRLWRFMAEQKAMGQLLEASATLRRRLGELSAQRANELLENDAESAAVFAALDPNARQAIQSGLRMKAMLEQGMIPSAEKERTIRTLAAIFYDRPPDAEDMARWLAEEERNR